MTTSFPQPYLVNRTHSAPTNLPVAPNAQPPSVDLTAFPSHPQSHSAYPPLRPLTISPAESGVSSQPVTSSLSTRSRDVGPLSPHGQNGESQVQAKKWIHRTSHPGFLPPTTSTPPPIALLDETLELVKEYREFVENVARVQSEFGRGLSVAVKRMEGKLDLLKAGQPGESKKIPTSSLQNALFGHLQHLSTVSNLHIKHSAAMTSQIAEPMAAVERREAEVVKKMGAWGKEICLRWEGGIGVVEKARDKFHAAYNAHQTAQQKLRSLPAPTSPHLPPPPTGNGPQPPPYPPTKAHTEYAKAQKAVEDGERIVRERKNAYLMLLNGEGKTGGGGQGRREGGGDGGWGEEARALYGHLHATLLETFNHHAAMDVSHLTLVASIVDRSKEGYSVVSLPKDQNNFLETYRVGLVGPISDEYESEDDVVLMTPDDQASSAEENLSKNRRKSTLHRLRSSIGHSDANSSSISIGLSKSQSNGTLSLPNPFSSSHSPVSVGYPVFVPPPDCPSFSPVLERERHSDANWLRNRWVKSRTHLEEVVGVAEDGGVMKIKRRELDTLKKLCETYMNNRGLGDPDEVWERRVGLLRELGVIERKAAVAQAEMSCVEAVLGGDIAPETAHKFKERLFPTPAICDVCQQKVWSAFAPEKACRLCSIAIHAKCELNVFVECQGPGGRRRSLRPGAGRPTRRSLTGRHLLRRSPTYHEPHGPAQLYVEAETSATPQEPLRETETHISPFIGVQGADRLAVMDVLNGVDRPSPPDEPREEVDQQQFEQEEIILDRNRHEPVPVPESSQNDSRGRGFSMDGLVIGRIKYDFLALEDYELTVTKGMLVSILEPDLDGCGWVKVRDGIKEGIAEGLVPATYVADGQINFPGDGGSGQFVIAMFDYSNPALDEHATIARYSIYELSVIGTAYDEFWSEIMVLQKGGIGERRRGIVPTSYIMPC